MTNHPNRNTHSDVVQKILADPAASYWLKDAIRSLAKRDPMDACNDAELLLAVAKARATSAMRP